MTPETPKNFVLSIDPSAISYQIGTSGYWSIDADQYDLVIDPHPTEAAAWLAAAQFLLSRTPLTA